MTFLLRRNGQIQTQSTGDRNSLEAWAVQDKWSLQFAFPSTRTTLLFIHVPALGRSRALRLSQTNLFCPPLQSSEGLWVHCTAGESPWSRQGESEEGNAGSTGLAWLFMVGGGDSPAAQRVCATPAAQPETAEGLRAFLSSFLCSFTLPVFHLTLFLCSWWLSQARMCSGVSHTSFLFACRVDFTALRVKLPFSSRAGNLLLEPFLLSHTFPTLLSGSTLPTQAAEAFRSPEPLAKDTSQNLP